MEARIDQGGLHREHRRIEACLVGETLNDHVGAFGAFGAAGAVNLARSHSVRVRLGVAALQGVERLWVHRLADDLVAEHGQALVEGVVLVLPVMPGRRGIGYGIGDGAHHRDVQHQSQHDERSGVDRPSKGQTCGEAAVQLAGLLGAEAAHRAAPRAGASAGASAGAPPSRAAAPSAAPRPSPLIGAMAAAGPPPTR